jgi:hypothetical protein
MELFDECIAVAALRGSRKYLNTGVVFRKMFFEEPVTIRKAKITNNSVRQMEELSGTGTTPGLNKPLNIFPPSLAFIRCCRIPPSRG